MKGRAAGFAWLRIRDKRQAVVSKVMNLQVVRNAGSFLTR
jgi:hypothetical protein